jgi:thioredoxin 1
MSQKSKNLTEVGSAREFEEAVEDGEVLVDFYADWCGPCKRMEPAVEEVAEEVADEGVRVLKVDIDENPKAASAYGVRSVPTLVFFDDGKAVRRAVGAKSPEELRDFVDG